MHQHIKDFYKESKDPSDGSFFKVIALHEAKNISYEEIKRQAKALPKGWFELSRLAPSDRLEFTRDFWLAKLPFHLESQEFLTRLFNSFEDIYVFLVKRNPDTPFEAHLVYALKNDAGFFKGYPPILESEELELKSQFPEIIFPVDYIAFLQIHNGFCKTTDCTGLYPSTSMKPNYEKFREIIAKSVKEVTNTKGVVVNPESLFPFYESFGMPFFQCFFKDWYPEDEMGNVYYSGNDNTISDIGNNDPGREAMAFPTFSDWLIFYLETIT